MSAFTCEFCNKVLSTKSNLTNHQENAKYCLSIRGEILKNEFICEYCNKGFSQSHHLAAHIKSCKTVVCDTSNREITIKKLTDKLEKSRLKWIAQQKTVILGQKNIKDRDKIIESQISIIKEKDARIVELEKSLAFEKGQINVYQTTKPSTKIVNKNCNNTVNSKLSHIQITTIKPFTIESISEVLPLYTEACFRNKLHGIMSLIVPMTTLDVDGVIERNIVCTDLARTVCHRLTEDREWLRDDGLSICKDILRLFAPSMTPYVNDYKEKFEEAERTLNSESHSLTKSIHYPHARRDFDNYFEILEDVRTDFYTPIIQEFGENYDTLIKNFRDLLKPAVYVRTIAAKD